MIEVIGGNVVQTVIWISSFLREEHAPGIVSAILVIALVVITGLFLFTTRQRYLALNRVKKIVADSPKDPVGFSASITQVSNDINTPADSESSSAKVIVAKAWGEYRETFVEHVDGDQKIQCNSVRPSQFFNSDDLHFGSGFYRVWPGLFVTIGLFLTFLGLVSALHAMNTAEGVSEEAMSNLLSVASAKFIMSLTGLACSIMFTVALRYGTGLVERVLHSLNGALEARLRFLSLEELAVEQIRVTNEQRDHFRQIGIELVEELGRPLREELPQTISKSISDAMTPLIQQVGEMGTTSVGDMVRDLSNRISTDVDGALSRASNQLERAGDRLAELVDRMAGNSDRMSVEMAGSSERLLEAVERFRVAAEEGTSNARDRMDQSGSDLVKGLSEAGDKVLAAVDRTGQELVAIAGEVTEKAGANVIEPMDLISQQMHAMVEALKQGVDQMQRASDGVRDGANATSDASTNFRSAAGVLVDASSEMKPTVDQLETSLQNLISSTRLIGESANANTVIIEQALESTRVALGGERRAVEASLKGLENVLAQAKGQGDRLDDIDEKLGRAFEKYRSQVSEAVDSLHHHVGEMRNKLTPAVEILNEVVAQAQEFIPESRSTRVSSS